MRGFQKFVFRSCIANATLSAFLISAALAYEPENDEISEPRPEPPPASEPALGSLEWGELLWLGKDCHNWDETPVIASPYRLYLPLRNWLKRNEGSRSQTGSCQFSLPLKVPAGFRLVVYSFSVQSVMNLAPETESSARAEIHLTSEKRMVLEDRQRALAQRLPHLSVLFAEEELVGECGQSWILKGSTETRIQGGKGLTTVKIDQMSIDYELQECP